MDGAFPGGNPPLDVSNLQVPANGLGNGNAVQPLLTALAAMKTQLTTIGLVEGTFLPTVLLGGTPVTAYAAQDGAYIRIGNKVFFVARVFVATKGAGVGAVTIGGLPFVANAATTYLAPVLVRADGLAGITNESLVGTSIQGSGAIAIQKMLNGALTNLTDVNIGVSSLHIFGMITV